MEIDKKLCKKEFSFGDEYSDHATTHSLHLAFSRNLYVPLPELISPSTLELIRKEVLGLAAVAVARDFVMGGYNTPRAMTTVGGKQISERSPLLRRLYQDSELRQILARIVGSPLFDNTDANEWCVSTWLNGTGQTHGYHLDDPPIALIIILEAPPTDQGGCLELIPDWAEQVRIFATEQSEGVMPLVDKLRRLRIVQKREHQTGDAYLLRADQCLHAVSPLKSPDARRSILNMAFETSPNMARESVTAAALFDA